MKHVVEVKRVGETPSRVIIGDVINSLDTYIPEGHKVVVITDANIHRRYKDIINRYDYCLIGMGETIKTLSTLEKLYSQLFALGADRSTFIIGFGGGIVTDIAGFVASTYMRGTRFGFVASTLLAQVDASVGGKNGVNFDGYKNVIGTFNQPDFVLCDTSILDTLPEREFKAGLAEIIKAGLIADPVLFDMFEAHTIADFRNDKVLLQELIKRAVMVKAAIVESDEKERGNRRILNLGHTFAHAIEKCTSDFLHGEAVAIGVTMIAELSVKEGLLAASEADIIRSVYDKMGLPTHTDIELRRLIKALKSDKKKDADNVSFVLLKGVGSCEIRRFTFAEVDNITL